MTENVKRLSAGEYIVWTQAGFRKALREMQGEDAYQVVGYPTVYPCVVSFSFEYRGYHYWQVHCVPLYKAIRSARLYLDLLVTSDRQHQDALKTAYVRPLWKRILGAFR